MLQKTEPYFDQIFSGTIHKQLLDDAQQKLILEIRKEFDREVRFAVLDFTDLSLKNEFTLPFESWLLELCYTWDNIWIFTKYKEEGSPETESILAFDIQKNEFLWQIDTLSFFDSNKNSVFAFEKVENALQYYTIDLYSGENTPISEEKLVNHNENTNLKIPIVYTDQSAYHKTMTEFLKEEYNILSVSNIEYLEIEQSLLISYYIYDSKSLQNYLLHLNEEGQIIQKVCLGHDLKGVGFQTFYTYKNYLLYIKNKSNLVCEPL